MAITIQSTYAEDYAKGYPGMVANGETSNRISRTVESAAGAAFGAPLYRGASDHGCVTTVGTLATFLGWAIADRGIVPTVVTGAVDTYPQYSTAGILTGGASARARARLTASAPRRPTQPTSRPGGSRTKP